MSDIQSVMILGRQPQLGLAELESLYGAEAIRPLAGAAVLDVDPCLVAFDRLGGTMKFGKLLTILDTTDWKKIESFLAEVAPGHAESMPEGKMTLGLSIYGLKVPLKQLLATGLTLKKSIRRSGRSVRLVPNNEPELNTAQVLHNNLTGSNGWELLFIRDGERTIIAQTVRVQDIESYTVRDRDRPKRDARVGMLPPKLAQIIINLGAGRLSENQLTNICDMPANAGRQTPELDSTALDPFCGTGVVLLEAALMGYKVYGSDLEPRMVEYSTKNYEWLQNRFSVRAQTPIIETGDATTHRWPVHIDFVAGEGYLGRPFTSLPDGETLAQTISDCNVIFKKFLKNIHGQIPSGTRLCLAAPAWQIRPGQFRHLPLLDSLGDLGYNPISFEHVRSESLLYYREGQIVARELLILTSK